MMYRARLAPRSSITPSRDSTHSVVSSGSMSGSWLGRPSLMTGRLRSVATGDSFDWWVRYLLGSILPVLWWPRHADPGRICHAGHIPTSNRRCSLHSEVLTVRTGNRPTVRDITDLVAGFVSERGSGLVHVF